MIERFFFDGVHVGGDHFPINMRPQRPGAVLPDAARTELSGGDQATMAAQAAGHPALGLGLP
jgi:hypothetical protein